MKIKYLLIIILIFLIIQCERNWDPISVKNDFYTSHNFEWHADTLVQPEEYLWVWMKDIWGTDENNVWCVGRSNRRDYLIWHWNGEFWQNINPGIYENTPALNEIFGFSENDFWIVGEDDIYTGFVLHYNGHWNRMDNKDLEACMSVWGSSSKSLFIGCYHGIIYKYDGKRFIKYDTGRNIQIHTIWGLDSNNVFAIGINNDNQPAEPATRYIFKYSGNNFVLLDSCIFSAQGKWTIGMDLWGTDMNNLYSPTGRELLKYENNSCTTLFYAPLWRVFGSSPYNIFTGGYYDVVYHFNGIDWAEVYSENEVTGGIWGIWCNDDYVFIVQNPGFFTRILVGKGKNNKRR